MQASRSEASLILAGPSSGQSVIGFSGIPSTSLDSLIHSRRKKPVRSQKTIVRAILEVCRTPSVQHWIMVRARLGYETFWHHMNDLLSRGMMDTMNDGNKTLYRVNANGLDFLNRLEDSNV
ncbi:MAG: winged helix-turn-helix domain-containing protein [Nitrososphaerales archaeon]